jgi:hypothetical protein
VSNTTPVVFYLLDDIYVTLCDTNSGDTVDGGLLGPQVDHAARRGAAFNERTHAGSRTPTRNAHTGAGAHTRARTGRGRSRRGLAGPRSCGDLFLPLVTKEPK